MQTIFPVLRGAGRSSLYVAVDDPDAHHARAKESGAPLELRDVPAGGRPGLPTILF
jgi:hypothetical protein